LSVTSCYVQQENPIPEDVASLLIPVEQLVAAYATLLDSAIFTTSA
jgi:hypothetical protein